MKLLQCCQDLRAVEPAINRKIIGGSAIIKKLESPDIQNKIDNIGVEIVQIVLEENKKKSEYLFKLRDGKVRNKDTYKESISYYDNVPVGISYTPIICDSEFKDEKVLIITNLRAKLEKLPKYTHFKTNVLLIKLDDSISFDHVFEFSINDYLKSCIKEAEQDFKSYFNEYIFLSLRMKNICIFRHDINNDLLFQCKHL